MKKQSPYLESWLLSFAILVFFNTEVAASKEINIEKAFIQYGDCRQLFKT